MSISLKASYGGFVPSSSFQIVLINKFERAVDRPYLPYIDGLVKEVDCYVHVNAPLYFISTGKLRLALWFHPPDPLGMLF